MKPSMISSKVRAFVFLATLSVAATYVPSARAVVIGPYIADAETLFLYHFDETSGLIDPGNPIVNSGSKGAAFNLTSTGGPDGRNNTGDGGYGAPAFSGFGSAFDVFASGDGTYHSLSGSSSIGGGVNTVGVTQSQADYQGLDGAFSYELMLNISDVTSNRSIISRDNLTSNRGMAVGIASGQLAFFGGSSSGSFSRPIPVSGDHAFVADEWFHLAITYTGNEGAANNLTFYWTRVDPSVTAANSIGNATLSADLSNATTDLYIGSTGRAPYRTETEFIDEVRFSAVARGADEFLFSIPEPSTFTLVAFGLAAVGLRRRSS